MFAINELRTCRHVLSVIRGSAPMASGRREAKPESFESLSDFIDMDG